MKLYYYYYILLTLLIACNSKNDSRERDLQEITEKSDSISDDLTSIDSLKTSPSSKEYSNERFKEVTVEQLSESKFLIKGKAQIFEANFGWVIEDGHYKLQKGYAMTDAGAPEWGNFNFIVDAKKKEPNTTLHLVLFETSAKDGSRQYSLPIPLF